MKKMKRILLVLVLMFSAVLFVGCKKAEADHKITVYTRDTSSGTRDGFFTAIGFKDAIKENTELVDGFVELESNGAIINAVKNDEYGIGYISMASLENSGLKGLKYEGADPTEANVIAGTYTMKRNFNYIIREEFATEAEEAIVKAFIAYLGTKEGKATIKNKSGIVEVKDSDPKWDDIKAQHPICLEDNSAITIKFGGSTSVESIAKALSGEFAAKCGNFVPEHGHVGSGDAFKGTQGSEKDGAKKLHIGFASREFKLTTDEKAALNTYGTICVDAIVAVVNTKNELSNITAANLKSVYKGDITKWSELE